MTHQSIHRGIEFASGPEHLSELRAWYDNLPDSEVKASITKVECREDRPCDEESLRVVVVCDHPFSSRTSRSPDEGPCDGTASIDRNPDALIPAFTDWIERFDLPERIRLGNRYCIVDWQLTKILPNLLGDLSPHAQAQREFDNHLLDCLELIRHTTVSDPEFAKVWHNSNEPFFAAGRLILGDFQWIREVPAELYGCAASGTAVTARLGEYAREYVGLMRLAALAGAESPLIERVFIVLQRFKRAHALKIVQWQALARELLDDPKVVPRPPTTLTPTSYEEIDEVCVRLRQDLVEATLGMQDEIYIIIDAVLPTLEAPQSSFLFTDKAEC
jgi:hypothetical protein